MLILFDSAPEDVRAALKDAATAGADSFLLVLAERMAETALAREYESLPRVLKGVAERLRAGLHGGAVVGA